MKKETADVFEKAISCGAVEGAEVHKGYSGRGMNGKETDAVVADSLSSLIYLVAKVASLAEDQEGFADQMADIRTDSMGRGIVIY